MDYQDNFQDMIARYNRELMRTYRRRQEDSPPMTAEERRAEDIPTVDDIPKAPDTPTEEQVRRAEDRPTTDDLPETPEEDTRPLYPLYDDQAPPTFIAPPPTPARAAAPDPAPQATDTAPMEVGYLQVWVTTATSALPVEGAHVTVSSEGGANGGREAQYIGVTDESGRTAVVPLPAKSPQLSLAPGGDPNPYTLYNIEAYADGFYRVENVGLPLYGGVLAVQPVRMIPLPERGEDSDTLTFLDRAPQGLNGEEAEE